MTQVTSLLLQNFSNMELHTSLYCYYPKYKAIAYYLYSVITFAFKLFNVKQKCIIHLIIGSSGDAIRSVPYIWLSKMAGKKICAQYHTNAHNIFSKIFFGTTLVMNALFKLDIHCFLSKRLKLGFDEVYPYVYRSTIISNALGKEWIDAKVLNSKERYRDIVFLGRWCQEKGVDDLIAAMSKIKTDVRCEFYTDYVPREVCYKNCKLFPWVNEAEVLNIMSTSKLLVLPSYAEAYPTVLLEAAACGTPFLATNIGGIPDIVEQSGAGRLFEVGNIDMMVNAINDILSDETKWQEMSKNGKAWVHTLTVDNIKKEWQFVYSMLCHSLYI